MVFALANLFLVINLGCEMIYIVASRLKAQQIENDKSHLVIRDITSALLGQTFVNYVLDTFDNSVLSVNQARVMLTEIVCSSVMRLDNASMDKLIDLMVMIYKWQMYLLSNPEDLLNLTLKHLDCIGKIFPDFKKIMMIDEVKQKFVDQWSYLNDDQKFSLTQILNRWLTPFNTKISLLMRAKLQNSDGSFVDKLEAESNSFFKYYRANNGENVYEIVSNFTHSATNVSRNNQYSFEFDQLFNQLNMEVEKSNLLSSFPAAFKQDNCDKIDIVENQTVEKLKLTGSTSNFTNLLEEFKLNSENKDSTDDPENEFSGLLGMLNHQV